MPENYPRRKGCEKRGSTGGAGMLPSEEGCRKATLGGRVPESCPRRKVPESEAGRKGAGKRGREEGGREEGCREARQGGCREL